MGKQNKQKKLCLVDINALQPVHFRTFHLGGPEIIDFWGIPRPIHTKFLVDTPSSSWVVVNYCTHKPLHMAATAYCVLPLLFCYSLLWRNPLWGTTRTKKTLWGSIDPLCKVPHKLACVRVHKRMGRLGGLDCVFLKKTIE